MLAFAAPAHGALKAPVLLDPGPGASLAALPAFAWSPVPGAYAYEFQMAADQNFNSPVLGRGEGSFATKNTRATLKKTLPNGRYWWRVRATSQSGAASPWSNPRSLTKAWTAVPGSQSPYSGYPFTFPGAPISLGWAPVNYAASYFITLASDPALANVVINNGQPLETWATNFVPSFNLLPSGTYYWSVTPVDSEGNKGMPSPVSSFYWSWPSTTTAYMTDLMTADEMFDPQFSWNPVPGATKYEVEVNSSVDFTPGSKVCCTQLTISTSLAPTVVFRDNTYYWRVRALDAAGNAGVWNRGPDFIKTFDKVPPVTAPSIKNLHMRDNLNDPGTDVDGGTAGYQTNVPILKWDSVPGASAYLVDVAPFNAGICEWGDPSGWRVTTSIPSWTPLGSGWTGIKPYPDAMAVAYDFPALSLNDRYCVRVRAKGERDTGLQDVYGDFTYLDDGTGTAFQWVGYPVGGACTPSCNAGYPGADDYVLPARGTLTRLTPLITWKPLAGRQSYFVLVSKDANFSNLVDYAFTQVPAYSPRSQLKPTTYSDETTLFYWAVLPATGLNGTGAVGDPLSAAASNFQKQSIPPSQTSPADGAVLGSQPVFRWSPVEGARRYRFQIAQEPTFAAPIEDVSTASTSYTPFTTHPADSTLYWRVRADDENLIGLTWSSVRTFQRQLAAPVPDPANVTISDFTPAWNWSNITGSSGYSFQIDGPDGIAQGFPRSAHARRKLRLPLRPRDLALACPRRVPEGPDRGRHRPVVLVRAVHANAERADRSADERLGPPRPAPLELEARREGLQGPDLAAPGLLDDPRGRDDRQHELRAGHDASVLRERRHLLLARRRAGQGLQRRRLVAGTQDRHRAAPQGRRQPARDAQALEPDHRHGHRSGEQARRQGSREALRRRAEGAEGPHEWQGPSLVPNPAAEEGPARVQRDQGGVCRRVVVDARLLARLRIEAWTRP